ncbi:Hypothetical protein A7982_06447 [Minicystis rosea]|nr:Hypothetical protein A7982_06447 [Minicystis rosea]
MIRLLFFAVAMSASPKYVSRHAMMFAYNISRSGWSLAAERPAIAFSDFTLSIEVKNLE